MGPRAAVTSLLACGVQLTVARFAHDPTGKKAHSHKFLAFCGDDGLHGGMYTISCEFNGQMTWPDMADGFSYLTYPVCTKGLPAAHDSDNDVFSACSGVALVNQQANNKGEVTRDPMKFPLKTANPPSLPALSDFPDVYQPVVVPVGEPETNPHHLVWPEGRQPSVAQLASSEAMGSAREKIKLLRDLAILHGAGCRLASRTTAHACTASPLPSPLPPLPSRLSLLPSPLLPFSPSPLSLPLVSRRFPSPSLAPRGQPITSTLPAACSHRKPRRHPCVPGSGDAELKKLHMKMDAQTLNIWDRIQIRDGLLMSTITHTCANDSFTTAPFSRSHPALPH